uniref:Uncharacterized protein n=1 Tax=Anguilla anguilla TaxID=7936 RepID=A0A0E9SYH9_ANGAN
MEGRLTWPMEQAFIKTA